MRNGGRLADTLSNRNFRRYAGAQFLHATGMWAHRLAELWLVYEITESALAVGIATAARAGSSVVLAPVAGTLADRVDRRRLLASTQFAKALTAGSLGAATIAMGDEIPLWLLLVAIGVLGVVGAIDTPLRRAFVRDVVTAEGLEGAARLHTSVMSSGRIVGGGLAALLLGLSVPWACFATNGAAFAGRVAAGAAGGTHHHRRLGRGPQGGRAAVRHTCGARPRSRSRWPCCAASPCSAGTWKC